MTDTDSPITDAMADAALDVVMDDGHNGLDCRPDRNLQVTVRAALEAAYPAIRKQVAEEIAVALDARAAAWTTPNPVPEGWDSHHLIVRGASELANDNAAKIAREIGAKG